MEFSKVLATRRMVRSYSAEPVDRDVVERIVDAGLRSPSAGFSQGLRCVIVTDVDVRSRIAAQAREASWVDRGFNPWISAAPVLLALCVDPTAYAERYAASDKAASAVLDPGTDSWIVPYWWVDGGASLMAILLSATNEGLASGFLGAHACGDLRLVLGIPAEVEPIGIVTLGHGLPDRRSASIKRGRRKRSELVFHNGWKAASSD